MQKALVTYPKMSSFQTFLLLIVTLCVSWKSANAATMCSAENEEWACKSGGCIATKNLCDGIPHCGDDSDETKASCEAMQCSFISFRCDYGACILLDLVCDGVPDCFDSSDEDSKMCLKRRNDLLNDETDEEIKRKNCIGGGKMECWSGECISITDKCNGVEDCEDGSDELLSLCQTILCEQDQFQCFYGACLPMKAKCNGIKDCWDGSDEYQGLCKQEISSILTPTTRTKSNAVTSIITDTYGQEAKEILDKSKAEGNKEDFENRLNSMPSDRIQLITTSTNENETMIVQNTSVQSPAATTSTENFNLDKIFKKHSGLNTKENVTKNYSENNLEITPPKIRDTIKIPQINNNQTFPNDIHTPSNQSKGNENKGQEYTLNVATQTPNLKANVSSSRNNSSESNLSVQSLMNSRPQTDVLSTSPMTHIYEKLNATEKSRNVNDPESTTKTLSNRYTDTTTNKAPTKVRTQCNLRSCAYPLICNILLSSSQDSGKLHDNQAGQLFFEGSEVVFDCADGYVLEGVNRTTCKANGWSHEIPSCKESYCDASILDDCTFPLICRRYDFATKWYKRIYKGSVQQLSQNETLLISCKNHYNYNLSGKNLLTCRGGKWDGTMPKCIAPSCRADLLPKCENPMICTSYDYNSGRKQDIIINYGNSSRTFPIYTKVVFNCTDGHVLNGAETAICSSHGWKYEDGMYDPECQLISNTCDKGILHNCTYPLICERFDTTFGDFKKIQSATSQKSISDAEKIKFSCENGYVLDGRNALTCKGGKWDHSMPKCIAPGCSHLLPKCGNSMICTVYTSIYYRESNQAINKNYSSIYNRYRLYSQGTKVVFNCTDGHVLNGAKSATCDLHSWKYEDGMYDPECQRISNICDKGILDNCTYPLICKRFDTAFGDFKIIQSATSQKSISDAEQIQFSCENGYVLDGRNALTCKGGKWDHSMPKCISYIRHNIFPLLPSCKADLLPECKYPLTCRRYDSEFKSEQTTIYNSIIKSTNYALYTRIVFGCAEGFKLKGAEHTTCTSYGWSHRQTPQCIAKDSFVGFNCKDGFKLQGSGYITCDSEGWNEPIPKCVK